MSLLTSRASFVKEPATSAIRVRIVGDEDRTLIYTGQTVAYVWREPLTAARTATLSSSGPPPVGARLRVIRAASATGASSLSVGPGLGALAADEGVDLEWSGSAWVALGDAPAAPYNLTARNTAVGVVALEWGNRDSRATSAKVYRSLSSDVGPGAGTLVDTLAGSANQTTDAI